jgi:hypothetical protein
MNAQEIQSRLQLSPDNPWPGLQSFDEASESFFFGMRAETDALSRLVRRETLTLFYGRSGLGKTSLLQAGLFPRLREANLLPIPIRLDYGPKTLPFVSQVKQAVASALSGAGIDARPPAEAESLWEYFHSSDVDFWDSRNRLITLVLVFDQFEERFTLGRQLAQTDAQAEVFLTELSQLVENRPPPLLKTKFEAQTAGVGNYDFDKNSCKVILSLREDFLPELENLRDRFPSILENTLRLQGMSEAQAIDVVLGPGFQLVNEQVAAEIVRFVGRADQRLQASFLVEPVLLSVVLYGLNQRRRECGQSRITSDLLSGSREQILDGFYEDALRDLPARARLLVEDGLLTSSGRRDTLAWEDALAVFGVDEQDVLKLIDRHLLRREDRSDGARIELVHDRLAEIARKRRDSRREQEGKAQELADLQARQAELEREKAIQRRKFRTLVVACVALGLFGLLVSGFLAWEIHQHSLQETYFSNVTQRFGIFEGVGPLTKEQVSRRSSSFKFTRRGTGGPLIRVQAVDSEGRLTHRHSAPTYMDFKYAENDAKYFGINENPARECQWEFVQDAAGRIVFELAYDKNEKLVWGFAYSPSSGNSIQNVAHFVGPNGLPSSQMTSDAEYVRIEYWPNGLEKRLSYFDRTENPRLGLDGAYAIYRDYDSLGLPKRVMAMDAHGQPMTNKDGVAITEYTHDAMGNPTQILALDAAGKPALRNDGWSRNILTYDDCSNQIESACFDTTGKPCLVKDGFAKATSKYDKHGNEIESAYFDTSGKPCLNKHGFAKATDKFDGRGNPIESACFDTSGKPCLNKYGVAKATLKYDERGNLIETASFDTSGKPCLNEQGCAKATRRYDDRSNWIALEFYGVDGRPCLIKDGCAKMTADYDERDNQIEVAWFDEGGKPVRTKQGVARQTTRYDERSNKIEVAYFDEGDKPVRNIDGYARFTASYDEHGNKIAGANFDEGGKPVRDNDGVVRFTASYDERGNKIAGANFDEGGKPVRDNDGVVRFTASYDERGNQTEVAYFDEGGKPAQEKDGYARFTASYDERGNQIEVAYFDEGGKSVRNNGGFARFTASYDARGNQIAGAYFDERDKPVQDNDGICRFTASYDERGNKIEVATFDEGGKPAQRKEGYARFSASYDARGNQIEGAYFDEGGKPVRGDNNIARFTASYDKRGNWIECEYYDVDGKPCLTKGGFAKIRASYDDRSRRLQQVEFDLTGKSTVKNYDLRGDEIEELYLDETGKPTANPNGITRWTEKYSEGGNPVDMTYFDQDGKPTAVEIYLGEVLPGGQANEAGLNAGDVLVSYDGKAVRNDAEFTAWVRTPGDTRRQLIVSRRGLPLTFEMKPGIIGVRTKARVPQATSGIGSNARDR